MSGNFHFLLLLLTKFNYVPETNQTSNQNFPTPYFKERCQEGVCLLVEGRGSRVNGRGSSVTGRGSRVPSRGSKNSSQLFLKFFKSKFRVYPSFIRLVLSITFIFPL